MRWLINYRLFHPERDNEIRFVPLEVVYFSKCVEQNNRDGTSFMTKGPNPERFTDSHDARARLIIPTALSGTKAFFSCKT